MQAFLLAKWVLAQEETDTTEIKKTLCVPLD